MGGKSSLQIYLGIFLLSLSALVLEISLTRVFSIAKWYHFAFMVISIALLGYGASGSFLAAFPSLVKEDLHKLLVLFSSLSSISIIIAFLITNQIPFDPFKLLIDPVQTFNVLIHYLLLSIPFFCIGCCLAIAFTRLTEKTAKIYFSDLLGAGVGSIVVIAVSFAIATPFVIVFSSILAALASLSFGLGLKKKISLFAIFWIAALIFMVFSAPAIFTINSSPYKSLNLALNYPGAAIVETKWNPFSKIDIVESGGIRYAPGLSLLYDAPLPKQLGLTVDNDSLLAITPIDGNLSKAEFVNYLPTALPFAIRKNPKTLILDSGTGLDVLTALHEGAGSIVAVESNPLIVESSAIYESEKVAVAIEEGRTFIKRTNKKFDLIQISLKKSIAASSTGLYAMNENYLFTVEAFEEYYNKLSENGVLSITRWLLFPPRESLKITAIAIEALERKGVEKPEQQIALIRTINSFTFLVKKSAFSQEEIQAIKNFCNKRGFDLIYVPGIEKEEVNRFNRFEQPYYYNAVNALLFGDRENEERDYLFAISPSYDDKPFFFNFFKLSKFSELYESIGRKWEPFFEGGFLIIVICIQALVLSALFILVPLYFFKKRKTEIFGKKNILGYFFLIGLAYMFIEISLMQRFILFLGQPVYAISTVLFSLLVFSGLGSSVTGRFKIENSKILLPVIAVLVLLVLFYLILLPAAFNLFLGSNIILRYLCSIILLAPLGFVMGMPFPIGIRLTGKISKELIPWAFCSNGCSSVLSSVVAVLIAISFGFSAVMLLAAVAYLGALALIRLF